MIWTDGHAVVNIIEQGTEPSKGTKCSLGDSSQPFEKYLSRGMEMSSLFNVAFIHLKAKQETWSMRDAHRSMVHNIKKNGNNQPKL